MVIRFVRKYPLLSFFLLAWCLSWAFMVPLGPWTAPLWLLNSGLGEESGWRGFALPMLQRRSSPRVASIVIASGWMIWHVPAFFYLPS